MATRLPGLSPLFHGPPFSHFTVVPQIYGRCTFYLTGIPRSFYGDYLHIYGNFLYFQRQFTVF